MALLVKLARHPSAEELKVEHMYDDQGEQSTFTNSTHMRYMLGCACWDL